MGSNEQLMPVQCMHIVLRSLCFLFFFLAFLVEIWCSAKHFAVSIAALLFCFYFACIIIATFSVCLFITLIYKLHFLLLVLSYHALYVLFCHAFLGSVSTSIFVVFLSHHALCFNIAMHYFY